VWVDDKEGSGGRLEAGIELLRLHSVRAFVGVELIVPFYDPRADGGLPGNKRVYPAIGARIGF
jgi:hypothetical protein